MARKNRNVRRMPRKSMKETKGGASAAFNPYGGLTQVREGTLAVQKTLQPCL